jgi:hypothetical protein
LIVQRVARANTAARTSAGTNMQSDALGLVLTLIWLAAFACLVVQLPADPGPGDDAHPTDASS